MNRLGTLAITLFVLLACHASHAHSAEKMTLILDWFINPNHAPIIVAREMGCFAKRGMDLEIIAPADPNDPAKLVAAGKADLALSYQGQHHIQVDQGLPLVRIATLIATPLNSLLVMADSKIDKIGDLRGKTIGYSVGGFETVLLKVMLKNAGLSLEDVKLVNVNFSLSPSLFTGQTDAVIGAYRNFELIQMAIEKRPGKAFFVEEYGIPNHDELIVIANRNRIGEKNLRSFVDGLEEGVQYLVNHPEKSWQLFIKGERAELNDELNSKAWKDTLPRFALRPGALDRKRYQRFAAFLLEEGIIKAPPSIETWAVELK